MFATGLEWVFLLAVCPKLFMKLHVSKAYNSDYLAFSLAAMHAYRAYQDGNALALADLNLNAALPEIVDSTNPPPTTRHIGSACAGMCLSVLIITVNVTPLLLRVSRWRLV
jgi:hypothetical protein